jgi:hypothetical protein
MQPEVSRGCQQFNRVLTEMVLRENVRDWESVFGESGTTPIIS